MQAMSVYYTDKSIVESLLKTDPEQAIKILYKEYYDQMCNVVWRMLNDKTVTEDIVQEVIMEVWRNRDQITFTSSLYGYLKKACVNRSLNFIRRQKVKLEDDSMLVYHFKKDHTHNSIEAQDLKSIISSTIMKLPDRCRQVFILSRYEYMSYKEIGAELNISVKTVENQIVKALRILKANVNPYLESSH